MELIRIEGILPKVLDRDLPEEAQYIKEREIYKAWQCKNCGNIEWDYPKDGYCNLCEIVTGFYEIEVDENMEEVE